MVETELLPGDLIFFLDALDVPQHVAVFNGIHDGVPFVSHAVTGIHYSVMTTRLKSEDGPYTVMRLHDFSLAASVAHRMRLWGEVLVPFSVPKTRFMNQIMDKMPYCHPKKGVDAGCSLAMAHFADNFYRYIEYAAHPDMPFHPASDEGFRCDEAVVAAFNVEQLLQNKCIKPLNVRWVSDSQYDKNMVDENRFSEPYKRYLENLASGYEYELDDDLVLSLKPLPRKSGFCPSIFAWNFEFFPSIEGYVNGFPSVLKLDSKLTWVAVLHQYCKTHPKQWQEMDKLVVEPKDYLPEVMAHNKALWQEHLNKLFTQSEKKQTEISVRCQTAPAELNLPQPVGLYSSSMVRLKRSPSARCLSEEEEIQEMLRRQKKTKVVTMVKP